MIVAKCIGHLFRRGEIPVLISAQNTAWKPYIKELLEFRDVCLLLTSPHRLRSSWKTNFPSSYLDPATTDQLHNCYHLKMFGVLRNNSSAKYRRNCPSVSPNQFLNTLYRIMESQSIKCWRDLKDHWVPNTTSMGSDTSL